MLLVKLYIYRNQLEGTILKELGSLQSAVEIDPGRLGGGRNPPPPPPPPRTGARPRRRPARRPTTRRPTRIRGRAGTARATAACPAPRPTAGATRRTCRGGFPHREEGDEGFFFFLSCLAQIYCLASPEPMTGSRAIPSPRGPRPRPRRRTRHRGGCPSPGLHAGGVAARTGGMARRDAEISW